MSGGTENTTVTTHHGSTIPSNVSLKNDASMPPEYVSTPINDQNRDCDFDVPPQRDW